MDRRHKLFFIAVLLLLLIIILRMALLAGNYGGKYRRDAQKISQKTGKLAAIRGRIYDQKDQLLVWSERCYDLVLQPGAVDDEIRKKIQLDLHKKMNLPLEKYSFENNYPLVLKYNLTAAELCAADELSRKYRHLSVELRWERRIADSSFDCGEVRQINGMEVGISGLEKKFDKLLRGTPGEFTVMLDRHGNWMNSTFQITVPPRRGEDIFLEEDSSLNSGDPADE